MPEAPTQGSLIEQVAPPVTIVPSAPVRKFVLPAETSKAPEAKAPPSAPSTEAGQNTADQAPAAAPEGEKPEAEKEEVTPEQAAKREGRRFERKLDKAYRKAAEAQARAEFLEKKLSEATTPKGEAGEPKLEQFDYDPEKYAAAKAEFEKSKALKEYEGKQRSEQARQHQERLVSAWEDKVEQASDKHEDFQTVVGELQPTNALISAIMECETADVAYYLGKHPKEAERIAALGPIAQIREVGKLEAKLALEPEKPKAPSKAPAPIKPLSGTGSTATDVPGESDDIGAWIKKRQKQVHRRS